MRMSVSKLLTCTVYFHENRLFYAIINKYVRGKKILIKHADPVFMNWSSRWVKGTNLSFRQSLHAIDLIYYFSSQPLSLYVLALILIPSLSGLLKMKKIWINACVKKCNNSNTKILFGEFYPLNWMCSPVLWIDILTLLKLSAFIKNRSALRWRECFFLMLISTIFKKKQQHGILL